MRDVALEAGQNEAICLRRKIRSFPAMIRFIDNLQARRVPLEWAGSCAIHLQVMQMGSYHPEPKPNAIRILDVVKGLAAYSKEVDCRH